jgi:hypothetical protein
MSASPSRALCFVRADGQAANAAQGNGEYGWGLDLVVASPSYTGS